VIDGASGQPEEDGLCDVLGVRQATGYPVSGSEDTSLVSAKDFLKLAACVTIMFSIAAAKLPSSALLQPKTR